MAWIADHARIWRVAALVLLLVAIIGPWAYDQINVPAEYPCSAPFVRLEGDFCGVPLSGMWVLFALGSEIIVTVASLVAGEQELAVTGRMFLLVLSACLLLLPAVSTLLLIFRGNRRRLQIFHITVLCLAGGMMLWAISATSELHTGQLWGPRLYAGSVLLMLLLEVVTFAGKKGVSHAR